MHYADNKVTRIVSRMAVITAVLIGLGLPIVFFWISYFYQDSALRTEAEINGRLVTRVINDNPEMWRFEELRLMDLISRRPGSRVRETRRILDSAEKTIAESREKLEWPVLTRIAPLLDSGEVIGKLEISRSIRPLFWQTALLSLLGALVGTVAYYTLRTFPLRMLRNAVLALIEEKERAQVTLHSIADGVITTDAEGRITLMNAVAERLTGWAQHEAIGRRLEETFHIVDEKSRIGCENPVAQVLRDRKPVQLVNHTVLVRRDGSERIIANSGAPILSQHGTVIGVVLVFRDMTEKQKLEAEMLKAGKLESLGILAGGIAHDFNNLLTVILGNISLALMYTGSEDGLRERLGSAESACLRARNLTYQLLTFSKGGTPVKESVSLPELIRSSVDFALTGSSVRSDIYIAENLPSVKADAGQLNQVLHNLIINAVEAMGGGGGGGGIITLRADFVSAEKISGLPLTDGTYVRITVEDRGTGILKEDIAKIFDPYFTTKKWGSGLGLAICYSIIKNHGGHITVDSEPGKGTAFHLFLPASERATIREPEAEDKIVRGKGTILVMDDEELVRNVVGQMLASLGYDVAFCANGEEAVDQYRRARERGVPFDAVILDLTVPGGMGGREAVRLIRELDDKAKAIVSSGYSKNPVMSQYDRYGFAGVLSKPYNVHQMGRVLHDVLHQDRET